MVNVNVKRMLLKQLKEINELRNNCENILVGNPDFPETVSRFYRDLIEDARKENERKLEEDNAELQEEEF